MDKIAIIRPLDALSGFVFRVLARYFHFITAMQRYHFHRAEHYPRGSSGTACHGSGFVYIIE
jgi:hypothetical protein